MQVLFDVVRDIGGEAGVVVACVVRRFSVVSQIECVHLVTLCRCSDSCAQVLPAAEQTVQKNRCRAFTADMRVKSQRLRKSFAHNSDVSGRWPEAWAELRW